MSVQLQEECKMPEVGLSLDRRTLGTFAYYGAEKQVHSLVCFICAQIWTSTTGSAMQNMQSHVWKLEDMWRGRWYPRCHQQCSEIRYYSVEQ